MTSLSPLHIQKNSPWDIPLYSQEEFDALSPSQSSLSLQQLQYFAVFGVLAPTSHNTVPQRFKFFPERNEIELFLDRKFVLAQSDPTGRQASVGMGCVIYNIERVSLFFGWLVDVTLQTLSSQDVSPLSGEDSSSRYTSFAKLRFSPVASHDKQESIHVLKERKVVRGLYKDNVPFPSELKTTIQSIAQKYSLLVTLHVYDQKNDMHTIGKFQEDADRTVFEDREFSRELGDWILENDDFAHPYGMRGYEFGFDDEFARKIHRGLLQLEPLLPDQIAGMARGSRAAMENSSAICILTVKKEGLAEQVATGRLYQEIALKLFQEGFSHSIYAGLTEVEWVRELFSASMLDAGELPLMLFRVGVPQRPEALQRPHSLRPTLEEATLQ